MNRILCAAGTGFFALILTGCPTGGIQSNREVYLTNRAETTNNPASRGSIGPSTDEPEEPTSNSQILEMRKAAKELSARTEDSATDVQVQHLLISFAGTGTLAQRTKAEAEKLAAELFAKVNAGADFDALVKANTDDSHPGIYTMVSKQSREDRSTNVFFRGGMVPAFGNTGWRLKVGEIGVAAYHSSDSPFGWHIVKRLK